MRISKTQTDYFGKVVVRTFPYTKNDNPTILGYYYGAIEVVRPVLVVNSKGVLCEKFELANMPIDKDGELVKLITQSEDSLIIPFLNHLVSDSDFEKLNRTIVSKL